VFVCSACGHESLRWAGKCPDCGQWGTLEETVVGTDAGSSGPQLKAAAPAEVHELSSFQKESLKTDRMSLGMGEIDRVLGGGIVGGEVVLLAGEPGIGKSTVLLQIGLGMGATGSVLYVSGEESRAQLLSRVHRLQAGTATSSKATKKTRDGRLLVTEDTDVDRIIAAIEKEKPILVIVDSIQVLSSQDVGSFPGSITQVRECGSRLTQAAKMLGIPVIIVGQVTKEGVIAGPKVLEHVVDAVMYVEGDEMGMYRIVRCVKNRFGTTDEVGILEMTGKGLVEVADPSNVFGSTGELESGSAVAGVYKGSRTLFLEIQALTIPAMFGAPRRYATGLNKQRLEMLCAVLTRRAGVNLSEDDVFITVLGGLRIDDPAVDLGVCMAVASAKLEGRLTRESVYIGEVGLSGDIREVPFSSRIQSEAKRRALSIIGPSGSVKLHIRDVIKTIIKAKKR